MNRRIYLDNAATTPVHEEVLQEMLPFFGQIYENPTAVCSFSEESRRAVERSRAQAAELIAADAEEIYFTAGGTESDNWAIKAAAKAYSFRGRHIITGKTEHHAVLHTCEYLKEQGFDVTFLDTDKDGKPDLEKLRAAIRPDTILISLMAANNEIGTIAPLREIGKIARENGVLFHTDAVQAYGHIPIHVGEMNIDLLSASGHKLNGPKGIGILYVRKGVKIPALLHGGAQERGIRAGTSNVPGIVGFGKAAQMAKETMSQRARKETALRDYLIGRVLSEIPHVRLNGHRSDRLPGNANFSFRFIEGESLLLSLDQLGICASSGSACTSGSLDPSHVLLAIGLLHEIAHGSLRITLSEKNTKEEMDYVADGLKNIVERLRSMSPLYEDFLKNERKTEGETDVQ